VHCRNERRVHGSESWPALRRCESRRRFDSVSEPTGSAAALLSRGPGCPLRPADIFDSGPTSDGMIECPGPNAGGSRPPQEPAPRGARRCELCVFGEVGPRRGGSWWLPTAACVVIRRGPGRKPTNMMLILLRPPRGRRGEQKAPGREFSRQGARLAPSCTWLSSKKPWPERFSSGSIWLEPLLLGALSWLGG
jgi:hypothetical protein